MTRRTIAILLLSSAMIGKLVAVHKAANRLESPPRPGKSI